MSDEPGSHGYVEYKIVPNGSTPRGTLIPNTAYIYFDFHPPVVTNTVTNQICPVLITGDVNLSTTLTSADIIYMVNFVFKSSVAPMPVPEAADVDCSGAVTSADIIYMVNHVFKSAMAPCDVCTDL